MRRVLLVSYDVADPRRWRRVYRLMLGVGDPVHFSVFRCELSAAEKLILREKVWPVLNHNEDRILLVDIGPVNERTEDRLECWGAPPRSTVDRGSVIV